MNTTLTTNFDLMNQRLAIDTNDFINVTPYTFYSDDEITAYEPRDIYTADGRIVSPNAFRFQTIGDAVIGHTYPGTIISN